MHNAGANSCLQRAVHIKEMIANDNVGACADGCGRFSFSPIRGVGSGRRDWTCVYAEAYGVRYIGTSCAPSVKMQVRCVCVCGLKTGVLVNPVNKKYNPEIHPWTVRTEVATNFL